MTNRRFSKTIGLLAGLAMMALAAPASAAPISNSPTGLAAPTTTLTFNEVVVPNNTIITNQYQAFGVTFGPNLVFNPQMTGFPNMVGNRLGNFFPIISTFTIDFNSAMSEIAFAMVTNPGVSTFTALLDGVTVETFVAGTNFSSANNYYGFTGITFDQIRVDVGGRNGAMLLDSLQFTVVPEPSTFALFGLALGGLGFMVRRRKALG
ncbi:MAG: PEP-CTERM sorting domain-containing protein [Pseudomonadota bacterium]